MSDNRREQADRTTPEETAPADTEDQMVAMVQGMDGKRLPYQDLTRWE